MTCASGTLDDDLADDLVDVGHSGDVALARVELRRDRHVADLGEPPADVLDVLVHAEDLLHDEDERERPALRRHGAVGGDLAVLDRDLDLTRRQARCCRS